MITWNNLDTLESFKELSKVGRVDIKEAMSGDNGAKRVKEYNIPMAEGFTYNFAAKQVDADVLEALAKLAKEAQLTEKFEALYNGAVINTGENIVVEYQCILELGVIRFIGSYICLCRFIIRLHFFSHTHTSSNIFSWNTCSVSITFQLSSFFFTFSSVLSPFT